MDNEVSISSFVEFAGQGWITVKYRVLHRDRALHRLKHAYLAKEARAFLQIHHLSLVDRPGEQPHEPFVGELYTETEAISRAALRRGHAICPSVTLKTGYDLRHRRHRPYWLVIAFPCSVRSVLRNFGALGQIPKPWTKR